MEIFHKKAAPETSTFGWVYPCSSTTLRLATNTFGWSRSMAKLKIVQKKISTHQEAFFKTGLSISSFAKVQIIG